MAALAGVLALSTLAAPVDAHAAGEHALARFDTSSGRAVMAVAIRSRTGSGSSSAGPRAHGKAIAAPKQRDAAAPAGKAGRSATRDREARLVETRLGEHGARVATSPARRALARRVARLMQAEYVAAPTSIGAAIGLKATDDPLDLRSSVAYVVDQDTGETLFDKNSLAVLPIASITKLMTALVTLEARLPLAEVLEITEAEIDTEKHTRSRLAVGTRLTRGEMLHLALMASENRASHALGRTYPGGLGAFLAAMNAKARALGMSDTVYHDPTGLSSRNQSNARDLVKLLRVAFEHPMIRDYSTAPDLTVDTGLRQVTFRNTNRLVREHSWEIGLQKTGFINEAGNCLVMQARFEDRRVWVVLLDAHGGAARASDAQRLRRFIGGELRSFSAVKGRASRA